MTDALSLSDAAAPESRNRPGTDCCAAKREEIIFESVMKSAAPESRNRPGTDPGTPLDRRGPPRTSISTKNQPRRPFLRPYRGTQKSSQIAFRYTAS